MLCKEVSTVFYLLLVVGGMGFSELPARATLGSVPVGPLVAPETDRPSIVLDIAFLTDSFELQPSSVPELNELADALQHPSLKCTRFVINGYSAVAEHTGFSMELSLLRAGAVMRYLISKGVDKRRLIPRGRGPEGDNPNASVKVISVGPMDECTQESSTPGLQ
jgi:outer membrane protein OmpA-like peptidoglycan-associated protein